ncbi:MAG: GntR family transcriptional regulator, partial [Geminicoccaceae bacterium]|nr:GntR family transcriptional regulator [Geminicoccaceae bacterium]
MEYVDKLAVSQVFLQTNPANPAITLAERVFEQLRTAIVEGEIPAGSKISEPALAARYGISRGPLREALRRLE